jgi:hypothetical protein
MIKNSQGIEAVRIEAATAIVTGPISVFRFRHMLLRVGEAGCAPYQQEWCDTRPW